MVDVYIRAAWSYLRNASSTTQCVVGSVLLYGFYRLVIKKKYRLPPGPYGLPLLGNLADFRSNCMIDKFKEWQKIYGPIMTVYMGPKPVIVVNDIDLMFEALVTRGSDVSSRTLLYSLKVMTEGFKDFAFAPYGDSWKYQRKVAVQSLRQYLTGHQLEERCHEALKPVVEILKSEKCPFSLQKVLWVTVVNLIHDLCFGNTLTLDDPALKRIVELLEKHSQNSNGFLEDVFPPIRYWPSKKFKYFEESVTWVNDYTQEHINEHRANLHKNNARCLTDNIILAQRELRETDCASLQYMTDVHARQILSDIFKAGIDTTRNTLDWIFLILVANPDIQLRMQKEIDQVVGERIPGKEDRAKLVYSEAVIFEVMRYYSVLPVSLPHETICNTVIGGYEIPAKTTVLINQHFILRDPKYWKDPLEFKPERFMSEDGSKIAMQNRCFIPFSMGHRSCPGESVAKLDILYIVVGLLQKFTFSLPPGEKANLTPSFATLAYHTPSYKVVVKLR